MEATLDIDRSIEHSFKHSCSDGCYKQHTENCIHFQTGECDGTPDEYNYSCLYLHHKGEQQRFKRSIKEMIIR